MEGKGMEILVMINHNPFVEILFVEILVKINHNPNTTKAIPLEQL